MTEATRLVVKVCPRSFENAVVGWWLSTGGCRELLVRVCAPPDDNKANRAVCEVLAKSIGIAKSKVTVLQGMHARHKLISFEVEDSLFQEWCEGIPDEGNGET